MKNKSHLVLKEMLANFRDKLSSEDIPIYRCVDPVLSVDYLDREELIPFFLCDGKINIEEKHWGQSFNKVWEAGFGVFTSWDFFIGMNREGLVTCLIVREGGLYFERLEQALIDLVSRKQVLVWKSGSSMCGSLESLKCFTVQVQAIC